MPYSLPKLWLNGLAFDHLYKKIICLVDFGWS